MKLRVGSLIEKSRANGPGERFVVWVKGCALACPGCFNPKLWASKGGAWIETSKLSERINAAADLRGVTISGGEPMEQPEAVVELLELIDRRLDTVVFTGFSPNELGRDPRKARLLYRADLVLAGRYDRALASDENPWLGSSNKIELALTGRVRRDEFPSCRVEARIAPDGGLILTGFPPPGLLAALP